MASEFDRLLQQLPKVQEELRIQHLLDIEDLRQQNKDLREEIAKCRSPDGKNSVGSVGSAGSRLKRLDSKADLKASLGLCSPLEARQGYSSPTPSRHVSREFSRSPERQSESPYGGLLASRAEAVDIDRVVEEGYQRSWYGISREPVTPEVLRDKVPQEILVDDGVPPCSLGRRSEPESLSEGKESIGFLRATMGRAAQSTCTLCSKDDVYSDKSKPERQVSFTLEDRDVSLDIVDSGESKLSLHGDSGLESRAKDTDTASGISDEHAHLNGVSFFMRDIWYERVDLLAKRLSKATKSTKAKETFSMQSNGMEGQPKGFKGRSSKGRWYKERKQEWPWYMIHPSSQKTITWGCISLMFLAYDLAMVPVDVCFDLEKTTFTEVVQLSARIFWTFDMFLSFFIGVVHDGQLMMNPRNVAKVYMRTWFPFDVCLVVTEWTTMLIESSGSPVSFFRALRWSRMVRLLRVVRFVKFQKLRPYMQGLIILSAEGLSVIYGLLRGTLVLVIGAHMQACLWHLVGDNLVDGWVKTSGLEDATVLHRYAMSLHWQFVHVQMESGGIRIASTSEYVIDSLLCLFSFCFAVYYTGMMANVVITWCNSHAARMASIARQFRRRYELSYPLVERMRKFLSANQVEGPFEILADDMRLKRALPCALQEDINYEIRCPSLAVIRLFQDFKDFYPRLVRNLCQETLTEEVGVEGEVVFGKGDVCQKVLFLTAGNFKYYCNEQILSTTPRVTPRNGKSGPGFDILVKGNVISEAVLWTNWEHVGELRAVFDSLMLSMEAAKFAKTVVTFIRPAAHAVKYAKHFTWNLNRSVPSDIMGWNFSVDDLDVNLFIGGLEDHFAFISHYKVEAGTEATLMRDAIQQSIMKDPQNPAADFQSPIFIDSEDLVDLTRLINHVKGSLTLVLLLTPGLLSRPWCLLEIVTAKRNGRPYVPVLLQRPGLTFSIPDEEFYDRLHRDEIVAGGVAGRKLLEEHGTNLKEVEEALRSVFRMIALPYSPHKSTAVRDAEVSDILKRCMLLTADELAEQTKKALHQERAKSIKMVHPVEASMDDDDSDFESADSKRSMEGRSKGNNWAASLSQRWKNLVP